MRQPVRLPATNGHGLRLITPRVLLLAGGNAAGKTTTLKAAQQRHAHRSDWAWFYPDSGGGPLKGEASVQLMTLMKLWSNRMLTGIAIEGTRIHDAVFRCLVLNTYPRHVYVGFMNQRGEVLVEHLRARNARNDATPGKRKKGFREDYWGGPQNLRKATYEGSRRVPTVLTKLVAAYPDVAPRVHRQDFEVDLTYSVLPAVGAWIDQVIAL